jgi:hypothetical protein
MEQRLGFLGHIIYIVASKLEFAICIVFLDIMKIAITL